MRTTVCDVCGASSGSGYVEEGWQTVTKDTFLRGTQIFHLCPRCAISESSPFSNIISFLKGLVKK